MTDFLTITSFILFSIATLASALYGLHMAGLLVLFARRQKRVRAEQREIIEAFLAKNDREHWPQVTTQLPIYNEADVVIRLIEAVVAMDYPQNRHEIQILDDSTDDTRDLVDRLVAKYTARGYDIKAVRRPDRSGYKAGALAYATPLAKGEYLPVFDADFVPPADFLKRAIALFVHNPKAACVQGRWGHLNRDESMLTRAQALGIDGHFAIEQGARSWNGLLMNFNGTAGIWRKAAILDENVGGWSADTLTEDLDLSYRVQLAGWKIDYAVDIACPAELPGTARAFKSQQRRWATGSIQVARKLLPSIWRAPLTIAQKVEATLHLTHYSIALFMLVLAVVARPMLLLWLDGTIWRPWFTWVWFGVCVTALLPSSVYTYARYTLGEGWSGVRVIPGMLVLGVGICLNNALAVIRGMHLRGGEFVRTPKSGSTVKQQRASSYAVSNEHMWIAEMILGIYSIWTFSQYVQSGRFLFSVFLLLYGIGFIWMGWLSRPGSDQPALASESDSAIEQAAPQTA